MKKIGLIGTGLQGRRYIKTLRNFPDVKLEMVCNLRGEFDGRKCFQDYKDLLNLPLDGVIIAANPENNVEMIKHANFLKIPVLVEKPIGLSLKEINKLKSCKIPILVNYTHLFNPHYQELKKHIKSPVVQIASIGYNAGPIRHYTSLYDYMPHDLSMCLDLSPGDYNITNQKATSKLNGSCLYRVELLSTGTSCQIMAGNGGTEKVRKLAVFCVNGDQFIYDDTKSTDYQAPLMNVVQSFLNIIDKTEKPIPFDFTLQIHNILHQLSKGNKNDK